MPRAPSGRTMLDRNFTKSLSILILALDIQNHSGKIVGVLISSSFYLLQIENNKIIKHSSRTERLM
jgi:hypothetical protein